MIVFGRKTFDKIVKVTVETVIGDVFIAGFIQNIVGRGNDIGGCQRRPV